MWCRFESVYNKNEVHSKVNRFMGRIPFSVQDFYERIRLGSLPEFDVLVTNPPFSGDHMSRLLEFCAQRGKPWLLLLPDFVASKKYYPFNRPADSRIGPRPFF